MTKHIRLSTTYALGDAIHDVEIPQGESETVPDMTMSLPELLSRYTRGLPIPQKNPVYDEVELPDFNKLDLVEIQELRDAAASEVQILQQRMQEAEFTKRQAHAAAEKARWKRPSQRPEPTGDPRSETELTEEMP